MLNIKILLYVLLLFLFPSIVQAQSWINLEQYINEKKMVDYGYGLWELDLDEKINTEYFNFNSFLNKELLFSSIEPENIEENNQTVLTYKSHKIVIQSNEALYFNEVDTMSIDTISHINYKIDNLSVLDMKIPFASHFETAYLLHFAEKDYILIYIKELTINNPFQGTISSYQGFLLDIYTKKLIKLPEMQTSNSVLCFSDYDKNGILNYINIDIYNSNIVTFYTLKNNYFEKDKYYIKFMNFIDMPFIEKSFLPKN